MPNTVSQGSPWKFYIRAENENHHIGIVDKSGAPIDSSGVIIKVYFDGFPLETFDEDTLVNIPRDVMNDFVKGIAHEFVDHITRAYRDSFQSAKSRLIHKNIREHRSPAQVTPIKILP